MGIFSQEYVDRALSLLKRQARVDLYRSTFGEVRPRKPFPDPPPPPIRPMPPEGTRQPVDPKKPDPSKSGDFLTHFVPNTVAIRLTAEVRVRGLRL